MTASVRAALLGCVRNRCHRDELTVATFLTKLDFTFFQCEQRVVFAHADIVAWIPACAALTDDDVARNDSFTTEFLYAEAFRL